MYKEIFQENDLLGDHLKLGPNNGESNGKENGK